MPTLISIIEIGGYPDFSPLYKEMGFDVISVKSVRKALSSMKKLSPDILVAEFNFQSDFRDRTSSLESILATIQGRHPQCKVIVLFEQEYKHAFDRLQAQYRVDAALCFPVTSDHMRAAIEQSR
ncbi:MAG: hypothetical protein GXP13_04120 [Gammaproteobacteria bacterium]|nr:hypothetical protein [Gammaproteobacteria bacterium]